MKRFMLPLWCCAMLMVAGCGETLSVYCGDGAVDTDEVCDDGNTMAGDGCSSDCQSNETCGNGTVDVNVGEACDDGNTTSGDGCQANCALPSCGDNIVDSGETCDDGNNTDGDGCSATCMSDETCGNGVLDLGESCDDGNTAAGDGCGATCQFDPYCGDGTVDPSEGCDDGNTTSGDGCNLACIVETTCGDGILDRGEGCDDGNRTPNDACDQYCVIEPTLTPGDTSKIINHDGWSVRCLAWAGNVCVHAQANMACTVCATYASCGVWHDITPYNNGGNRTALNFCAIATGIQTVLSVGSGGAAVAPRGCGWSATNHPICLASMATYHAPQVTDLPLGINLEEGYCKTNTLLITIECAGW